MPTQLASIPTWILSSAATRSHQVLHDHLSRLGVSGYEFRCLTSLLPDLQMSQAQLGESAVLDPRDVTHTLRALEDRGLLSRTKDPDHGRRILVTLTQEGQRTAKGLVLAMSKIQNQVFGDLSAEELSVLLALLTRVARSGRA